MDAGQRASSTDSMVILPRLRISISAFRILPTPTSVKLPSSRK
jgi:hypothetical protein